MRIDIATLFVEMCEAVMQESIIGRARAAGHIEVYCHNIRDYCTDRYRRTDDYPYGGGQGMIMLCEPLAKCLEDIKGGEEVHTLLMSPRGRTFNQQKAVELLERKQEIIELSRLLGGAEITETTFKVAEEIKKMADELKKNI